MKKFVLPISILLAAGGAGFGIMEYSAAQNAARETAAAQARVAELEAKLAELQKKEAEMASIRENNVRLQTERDSAKKKLKELEENPTLASNTPGAEADHGERGERGRGGRFREMAQDWVKQLDNPEVRQMFKQRQERMISRGYEQLFSSLKLTPDESKLLTDILAERNLAALDKGKVALDGNQTDESLAQVRKDVEATKIEFDSRLKAVLGEERFTQFGQYERTVGDRRTMEFASETFNRRNAPLNPQQKEALLNIMSEERKQAPADIIPNLGGGPGMTMFMSESELKAYADSERVRNKRIMDLAPGAGLSPDQVLILGQTLEQSVQWKQFGGRGARGMFMGR